LNPRETSGGSWVAFTISRSRIEAMTPAPASWTAAVLCRFRMHKDHRKAPEDWRSPKPRGGGGGSWTASTKSISRIKNMNPMIFPQIQNDHGSFLHFFIGGRSESVGDGSRRDGERRRLRRIPPSFIPKWYDFTRHGHKKIEARKNRASTRVKRAC
jgi:hypothetical protein